MDPATAITIAKGIANATGLDTWIKGKLGDVIGEKAAEKVVSIAETVTRAQSGPEALAAIQKDKAAKEAVRQKLLDREHELVLASLQDVRDARTMYGEKNEMADVIATQVIKQNHFTVLALLIANGLVLTFVEDKVLGVALGNLIGASIGALWHERQQVIGFFFGSSLGSKMKTVVMGNPAKKDA